MAKYKVMCVRYGWIDMEAENEEAALEAAKAEPESSFYWSGADDHQVVEEIDYEE